MDLVDKTEFAICVLIYAITMLFGIASNILVLAVVLVSKYSHRKAPSLATKSVGNNAERSAAAFASGAGAGRQRTVADDTLICLCSSDLIVISVCIPVRLARWFTYTWTFGEFLCKAVFYLQSWSAVCSVITITFLALQRYYAAVHPLTVRSICTSRFVRISLVLIFILSAILTLPLLFGQIHRPIGSASNVHYWCVTEFASDLQLIVFELYMFALIVLVPLAIMTTLYSFVLCKIKQQEIPIDDVTKVRTCASYPAAQNASIDVSGNTQQRRYLRVMQLLILSLIVFTVCWTPYQTDNLLSALGVMKKFNVGWLRPFRMINTLLAHANSCLNPYIYCLLSPNFRKSVRQLLKRTKV